MTKWGVWCEVMHGTVTRRQWLKHDDALAVYDKREDAEAEAKRLQATLGSPTQAERQPQFKYTVRPMP